MELVRPKLVLGSLVIALSCALGCEGQGVVDQNGSGMTDPDDVVEREPGPIQDRMPTMDDCAAGDEVFTNDAPARLLTRYEYDNSVRDLLGIDAGLAREHFSPENSTGRFENSVTSHVVNPLLVRKYLEIAETLAADAVAADAVGSVPEFLYRAFRRPPTSNEVEAFERLHDEAAAEWGTTRAREMVVAAVLQSPQFLYRIEVSDDREPNEVVKNDSFEMATRLSYMLWATMPDEELFAAAERGELQTEDEIRAQVARMLEDPRSREMVGHFYRQWLHLDALRDTVKDEATFSSVSTEISQDWRASIDEYIQWVHFEGPGTLERLMTANTVFVTPDMAAVYETTSASGLTRVTMPSDERAGLLTQPALMALLAYPDQGSPIHRGIFVREKLLCQHLAPPPDDMMIDPPDPDPNATTRERFAEHSSNDACAGCHQLIDPIGFGFERYDGVGRYREAENGVAVDASGEMIGSGEEALDGEFDGAVELSRRLAGSEVVAHCISDQWMTFALGRPATQADLCSVNEVRERFQESDGSFEELLTAIAMSDAMRYRIVQGPDQ